jgi:hypothetical protein
MRRLWSASSKKAIDLRPFLRKPEVPEKPEYNHLDLRQGLIREKALLALVSHSTTVPLVVQLLSPTSTSTRPRSFTRDPRGRMP